MKESKNPSNINLTLTNLPKHEGLQIIVTIFKIDLGYSDPNFGPTSKPMNATISVLSPNFTAPVTTFQIAPTYGSNICSGPQNEVIFVFNGAYPTHNST